MDNRIHIKSKLNISESPIIYSLILFLLLTHCSVAYSLQQTDIADSIHTEENYFYILGIADSVTFIREFEYPFIVLLNDRERRQYERAASLYDRKEFIKFYWKREDLNPLIKL